MAKTPSHVVKTVFSGSKYWSKAGVAFATETDDGLILNIVLNPGVALTQQFDEDGKAMTQITLFPWEPREPREPRKPRNNDGPIYDGDVEDDNIPF